MCIQIRQILAGVSVAFAGWPAGKPAKMERGRVPRCLPASCLSTMTPCPFSPPPLPPHPTPSSASLSPGLVLCSARLCSALLCSALLCSALFCSVMLCSALRCWPRYRFSFSVFAQRTKCYCVFGAALRCSFNATRLLWCRGARRGRARGHIHICINISLLSRVSSRVMPLSAGRVRAGRGWRQVACLINR